MATFFTWFPYIYVHIHKCTHVYIYICIHEYMYICKYVYKHVYMCVCVYVYVCIYVYIHTCICICVCVCDSPCSYMWHACSCSYMWHARKWHASFVYVTWLHVSKLLMNEDTPIHTHAHMYGSDAHRVRVIHTCDRTLCEHIDDEGQYVRSPTWMSHAILMNGSCHTHEWVMTRHDTRKGESSHVTHMNESCHPHEWVMSPTWMSHVTHMNESCHAYDQKSCRTYEQVTSHIWTSHVTHVNESCHTYAWVMSHISPVTSSIWMEYPVATISTLLKIIGLFRKRAL